MSSHHDARRMVLKGIAAAGCALGLSRLQTAHAAKLSQAQAKYQDQPKGDQNCANCMHFVAPDQCKVVDGPVSPNGWSILWAKKPG